MNIKTLEVPIEDKSIDFNKVVADSDSLETPPALFRVIEKHFSDEANKGFYVPFNLDVCCDSGGRNSRVSQYYLSDGLNNDWSSPGKKGRVWCNPPYSNFEPWLRKAYSEVKLHGNCELAVILLKLDCTTKLYSLLADEIYLLVGRRIRFIGRFKKPDGTLSINTQSRDSHCLFVFKG